MVTFQLLKINIFNFACYYGENVLALTTTGDKNIFLFNVLNGHGKTSLFHAIKWAFYGEKIEYFKDETKINVKSFLNNKLDPSKDSCFVELTFKYGKNTYILKRVYKPSQETSSYFTLVKDGREMLDCEKAQDELDLIFPQNFADFFMFDGEQLSKFMTAQKEMYCKESIHQLLGLKQLRLLKEDLETIHRKSDNRLVEVNSANSEIEGKKHIIKGIIRDISNNNLKIDGWQKKIDDSEQLKDEFDSKIKLYAKLPKVMDDLEAAHTKLETVKNQIQQKQDILIQNTDSFFANFIKKDLKKYVKDNVSRIDELKEICGLSTTQADTQRVKESILQKSIPICEVCGHTLTNAEKKKLEEEQKKLKESVGLYEKNRKERDSLKNENELFESFLNNLKESDYQKTLDDLDELILKKEGIEKEITTLKKKSQKKEYGDLATLNREINDLVQLKTNCLHEIKLLKEKNKGLVHQKEELTKDIKRIGHDDKTTQKVTNMCEYLSKLIKQLVDALNKGTTVKRESILKKSNELFLSITNKPDEYLGLEFENEDSYSFVIRTKDKLPKSNLSKGKGKIVTNPSRGEKQVLAMSFLLGLNQYTGRNNVILMDTPVASLDNIHSAGIGKALSQLQNQVIFLAQPQELKGEIYTNMKPAISKEFTVKRKDGNSLIEEVKK